MRQEDIFLCIPDVEIKIHKYRNILDAIASVKRLGIKTPAEYKLRHDEDPKLPDDPTFFYRREWNGIFGWTGFLGKPGKFYVSVEEAMQATKRLGIKTVRLYRMHRQKNPMLPAAPEEYYKSDWERIGRWAGFFGKKSRIRPIYQTVVEAMAAVQRLGIKSEPQYMKRYSEDSRLPRHPDRFYGKQTWKQIGRWRGFFRKDPNRFSPYPDVSQAIDSVQRRKIKTAKEYKNKYYQDPRLPAHPDEVYKKDWERIGKWKGFLSQKYLNTSDFINACRRLKIRSSREYERKYKQDTRLPANPKQFYGQKKWKRIGKWKGIFDQVILYPKMKQAMAAAKRLGIYSETQYKRRLKEDRRLPSQPHRTYKNEWKDWYYFFGNKRPRPYKSIKAAMKVVAEMKIKSQEEYRRRYKEHPRLRSNPDQQFKKQWKKIGKWRGFLQTERLFYSTVEEAMKSVKNLNIKTMEEYFLRYKEDSMLPYHPGKKYADDWQRIGSWTGFLGKKRKVFYATVREAAAAAQKLKITGFRDYKQNYRKDPKLPSCPYEVYFDEWDEIGKWEGFLGIKQYQRQVSKVA